jgi:hypothetical protein
MNSGVAVSEIRQDLQDEQDYKEPAALFGLHLVNLVNPVKGLNWG